MWLALRRTSMFIVFVHVAANIHSNNPFEHILKSPTLEITAQNLNTTDVYIHLQDHNVTLIMESTQWIIYELKCYIYDNHFDTVGFTQTIHSIEDDLNECMQLYNKLQSKDERLMRHLWFAHRMFRAMCVAVEAFDALESAVLPEKIILRKAHIANVQIYGLFDGFGFPEKSQVGYSRSVFRLRRDLNCLERDFGAGQGIEWTCVGTKFGPLLEHARSNLDILLRAIPPHRYPFEPEWEECELDVSQK